MRRLLCALGLHKRSRGSARVDQAHPTSVCRYCAVPMAKLAGRWRVDRQSDDSARNVEPE